MLMPKRIASTIEWSSEEERDEAHAKTEQRGLKFATYVKKHIRNLPIKRND